MDTGIWPRQLIEAECSDEWESLNRPLWTELDALLHALSLEAVCADECAVIGISRLIADKAHISNSDVWPHTLEIDPSNPQHPWQFLGFDVSDTNLLSGLSNCGFTGFEAGVELQILRDAWKPFLNDVHLFDDVIKAHDFRLYADTRVAEHAPFFVHGLWRIPWMSKPTSRDKWG